MIRVAESRRPFVVCAFVGEKDDSVGLLDTPRNIWSRVLVDW